MNVFISYRRADTKGIAGRLADRLNEMPGIQKIFIDVDGIDPGANFVNRIDEALKQSDACLILIGNKWMDSGNVQPGASEETNEKPRICEDGDFVRREVAGALASGKRVIPVLVDDATMPEGEELPPDISPIVTANAVFLRHASFDQDLDVVEDGIFSHKQRTPVTRFFRRHPFLTLFFKIVGGVLTAGVLLLILAIIHNIATGGRALNETFGSTGLVSFIILASLTSGGAIAAWRSLRR
jgi:hypothetical protein